MRLVQTILATSLLALSAAGHGSAQSPAAATPDAVTAEIRALRTELADLLHASIRSQLLVARLQLQEQRILTATRQLQEVEQRIRENDKGREQAEQGLKGMEEASKEDKDQAAFILGPLKAAVEKAARTDAELKVQQTQLQGMVAEEQQRWSAFNARLDELEQVFTRARAPIKQDRE